MDRQAYLSGFFTLHLILGHIREGSLLKHSQQENQCHPNNDNNNHKKNQQSCSNTKATTQVSGFWITELQQRIAARLRKPIFWRHQELKTGTPIDTESEIYSMC